MKKIIPSWRFEGDHNKISLELAHFVLAQAEKRLQDIQATASELATRTVVLLGFQVAILTGFIGYFISDHDSNNAAFWVCLSGAIYSSALLLLTQRNLRYREFPGLGARPKEVLNGVYFANDSFDNKLRELFIVMNEFELYQAYIEIGSTSNKERAQDFNTSITLTICTPIVLLATLILFWCR